MQTIPDPPDETPDAVADGMALLAYTVRNGHAPFALPAYRLERAEHAAIVAIARRPDEHAPTVATLERAQRLIGAAIRRAIALDAEPQSPTPEPQVCPRDDDERGNLPTHPHPFTRPPAPASALPGGRTIAF